jgi:hypothetical protein
MAAPRRRPLGMKSGFRRAKAGAAETRPAESGTLRIDKMRH